MRWSLQELFRAISYQFGFFSYWRFWRIFGILWRSLKAIVHWIFYGYCQEITWNLDEHLIDILIDRLTIFKKSPRMGYPCDLNSQEEFNVILERIIEGFKIMRDETFGNDYEKVEPIYNQDAETGLTTVEFNMTEEQKQQIRDAWQKQKKHDEETLQLFIKYFRDLWD